MMPAPHAQDETIWQITLHAEEEALAYAGTFFVGAYEDALSFALDMRERNTEVWIRVEHIPCLQIA